MRNNWARRHQLHRCSAMTSRASNPTRNRSDNRTTYLHSLEWHPNDASKIISRHICVYYGCFRCPFIVRFIGNIERSMFSSTISYHFVANHESHLPWKYRAFIDGYNMKIIRMSWFRLLSKCAIITVKQRYSLFLLRSSIENGPYESRIV